MRARLHKFSILRSKNNWNQNIWNRNSEHLCLSLLIPTLSNLYLLTPTMMSFPESILACFLAAASSMRSFVIPEATAFAIPPSWSISLITCKPNHPYFYYVFSPIPWKVHAILERYDLGEEEYAWARCFLKILFIEHKPQVPSDRSHRWAIPSCTSRPKDQQPEKRIFRRRIAILDLKI